jgi:hypothetical protein
MDEDFTCQWRQMEHHCLVVETTDENLVLALLIIETARELLLL